MFHEVIKCDEAIIEEDNFNRFRKATLMRPEKGKLRNPINLFFAIQFLIPNLEICTQSSFSHCPAFEQFIYHFIINELYFDLILIICQISIENLKVFDQIIQTKILNYQDLSFWIFFEVHVKLIKIIRRYICNKPIIINYSNQFKITPLMSEIYSNEYFYGRTAIK